MNSITRHKSAMGALLAEYIDKSNEFDKNAFEPEEIDGDINTKLRFVAIEKIQRNKFAYHQIRFLGNARTTPAKPAAACAPASSGTPGPRRRGRPPASGSTSSTPESTRKRCGWRSARELPFAVVHVFSLLFEWIKGVGTSSKHAFRRHSTVRGESCVVCGHV